MSGEVGTIGEATPTSVTTPPTQPLISQQIVNAGIAKGGGWFGTGGLPSILSGLPNIALIAGGAVLVIGALLISTKDQSITVVSRLAEAVA